MATKIFVSYRSLDSEKVDVIVSRLRSLKMQDGTKLYDMWQDKTDIPAGHDWWKTIVKSIIDCDVFLFMISSESVKNVNCRAELSYARKRNRPIIPLVLDGEYTYDYISGRNVISFSNDIPDEIISGRFQYLFYEGAAFVKQLNDSINRTREVDTPDIPAPEPLDPRTIGIEGAPGFIYDQACDYAWRLEFATAEKLFQRLIDWRDQMFSNDAREWVIILREYQQIMQMNEQVNVKYKVFELWQEYMNKFPKPFTSLFDPLGFQKSYSEAYIETEYNNPLLMDYPYNGFRDIFRDVVPPQKFLNGNILNLVFGELSEIRDAVPVLPINQDFDFAQRGPNSVLHSFENIKVGGRPFYDALEQIWPRSQRPLQCGVGETSYIALPQNSRGFPGVLFVVTTRYQTSTSYGLYVNTPLEGIDFAIDRILDCVQKYNLNSLALPLLGTGYANIKKFNSDSLKTKVSQLVLALLVQKFEQRLLDRNSKLHRSIIVIYSKNPQSSDEHEIWAFALKFIYMDNNMRKNQIAKLLQEFD